MGFHDDRFDHFHFHHHHRMHWRRPMGPIGRFVRARLRRRIFAWFASGMVMTSFAVSGVLMLVAKIQEPEWTHSFQRGQAWVGRQFAREWADPARRNIFAQQSAAELDMNLELFDASGRSLLLVGDQCTHVMLDAPVMQDGARVGTVRGCLRHVASLAWRWPLGVLAVVSVLWLASGRIARRLAHPLDELAQTVKRIGNGDLTARTKLSFAEPDEIGVVADAVNEMAVRLEKQVADQRELLATVSHELRTPLARVRIISEIARETGATPKTFDDLDREVVEMDALVGDLLASSRVEFGVLSVRDLSLRDVLRRATDRCGVAFDKVTVVGDADTLRADATLLQRALSNLLQNAAKHGGGVDQVRASIAQAVARFEVLDRGPGFQPGETEHLFQKFRRNSSNGQPATAGDGHAEGSGSSEGLGLGLALVKKIAVAHGGRVWAANREGGGAVIGFEIPFAASVSDGGAG